MNTNSSLIQRSTAPTTEQVDSWLRGGLGFRSSVVGHSYLGSPLTLYQWNGNGNTKTSKEETLRGTTNHQPTLLFISLVHGNEPLGLLALLEATQRIVRSNTNIHLLLLPMVNVDAYQLNLKHGKGCRRTNLRRDPYHVAACNAHPADSGVDLNRNHPRDWSLWSGRHGSYPWSEPESRAIRYVVVTHKPTAALSFHTRSGSSSQPLLIHPYTSTRGFSSMALGNQAQYKAYGQVLNQDRFYSYGTAIEAIHYTAGGSTIDWMHSEGVLSMVVEVVPPCNDRWCDNTTLVVETIQRYSQTGKTMADLLVSGKGGLPVREGYPVGMVVVGFVVLALVTCIQCCCFPCIRCWGAGPRIRRQKVKADLDTTTQETQPLARRGRSRVSEEDA